MADTGAGSANFKIKMKMNKKDAEGVANVLMLGVLTVKLLYFTIVTLQLLILHSHK